MLGHRHVLCATSGAVPHCADDPRPGLTVLALDMWLLRVDRLSEEDLAPLLPMLDSDERAQMARFHHARNRVEYGAAHVLTRLALAQALSSQPSSLSFVAG